MMDKYDSEDRGIKIIELEGAFQMCTKQEMYDYLIKALKRGLYKDWRPKLRGQSLKRGLYKDWEAGKSRC